VVTFSPVSSLDDIIAGYKVDVRNVPITNIAPLQALSARRYMQKVRTVQPQSMFDIKCEGTGTVEPVEWTADLGVDLKADWDEKYFKVLLQGTLGATYDFQKTPDLSWSCALAIPAGAVLIGTVTIEQELEISASVTIPSFDIPTTQLGTDITVNAGLGVPLPSWRVDRANGQ